MIGAATAKYTRRQEARHAGQAKKETRMTKRRPMTEEEWLAWASPEPMLYYLHQHRRIGRVPGGQRRLRLFRCACCRSAWDQFEDERCRQAVEVSERYADGNARRAELAAARQDAEEAQRAADQQWHELARRHPAGSALWRDAYLYHAVAVAAHYTAGTRLDARVGHLVAMSVQSARIAQVAEGPANPQAVTARREEERIQADFLRDLFGNPFRPPPTPASAVLAWNDRTVVRIARAIYEERAFDRLPILADALLDAGCDDEELIRHCRSEGPHVRGCWAVDLILGKS
jgi:hypothetical protein